MTASQRKQRRGIPLGLKRVRKELPPPGKIFKSRKKDLRKRAKEELRREQGSLYRSDS